jgi:anti-sigma factor RsiW
MAVCESMMTLLLASVEGTLDAEGRERLAAHVSACASCRRALTEQTVVKRALAEMPLPPVSPDFAARVRQRVSPPRWLELANWRAWTLRLVPVAAALIALLVVLPTHNETSNAPPESLSSIIDSWTSAGAGPSASDVQLLLNPDAHPNALLDAALEASSR